MQRSSSMAFGCVLVVAMGGLAFLAVVTLAAALLLFFGFLGKSGLPIETGAEAITAAFTAVGFVGAALGFVVTKAMEFDKERKDRLAEKKREVYSSLLNPWIEILIATRSAGEGKKTSVDDEQLRDRASRSFFDAIVYGSDDVVREFGAFRTEAASGGLPAQAVLSRLASILRAIRRDVGHESTKLTDVEILRVFVVQSRGALPEVGELESRPDVPPKAAQRQGSAS